MGYGVDEGEDKDGGGVAEDPEEVEVGTGVARVWRRGQGEAPVGVERVDHADISALGICSIRDWNIMLAIKASY